LLCDSTMVNPRLLLVRDAGQLLCADQRGGISVEYLVVTVIGLVIATGLTLLGVTLVGAYGASLQLLYGEYP
jgi:Flp pilus assembly pilin Flp